MCSVRDSIFMVDRPFRYLVTIYNYTTPVIQCTGAKNHSVLQIPADCRPRNGPVMAARPL
jgi:hypothetical protein